MKRTIIISALALLALSCQKQPSIYDRDGEYLVYTAPDKDADFSGYGTFTVADSLLVIGLREEPYYSKTENALALVHRFRTNMEKKGYVYTADSKAADVGLQVTYIIKTERYVQYYESPYWWLDYPGYWRPGYWGDWHGYYHPGPVTYTQSSNALLADMVDLTQEKGADKTLAVVWSSYIGGYPGYSSTKEIERMGVAIDQAFAQSPYMASSGK